MLFDFTFADVKDLRWLLETVIADQEHFLEDETDPGAVREATRAKRRAERLLKRLAQPRRRIRVVSTRDICTCGNRRCRCANGDSEIRLVPGRIVRVAARRQAETSLSAHRTIPNLATLLNCAEADLFGYLEVIDVSARDKEHSAAQTVRELHAALKRLQLRHTCPLSKYRGTP